MAHGGADVSDVLLIVPAFNEEESLPRTIEEARRVAPWADIVVVDDHSRDATITVARAAGVPVIPLPFNLGVGGALQAGFAYALARGYAIGVQFDADGQHDPACLERVVTPVRRGTADVSIGSRYVASSGYRAPFARRMGMRLFSALASALMRQPIADTTSGLRAYARPVMAFCLEELPHDFPDAPLLILLHRAGFRLCEVPVEMRERLAGESFYTMTRSLYYPFKVTLASIVVSLRARRSLPVKREDV
jgi:glycosyltransferase involved in cell wall biosynthesis